MHYRDIILKEFIKRRESDPFYSLRKLAAELDIQPIHLSRVLKGKKGLSKENAYRIARRLGLTTKEAIEFRFKVKAEDGRSKVERNAAKQWLAHKEIKKPSRSA